jgi:hypothetical protein
MLYKPSTYSPMAFRASVRVAKRTRSSSSAHSVLK